MNINPTALTDGVAYCASVPITGTEADLGDNVQVQSPVPTEYGQAIVAVVQLSMSGFITGNNTYVVMQMDMGDGVWVDLNWLFWTGTQGSATFVLSNGIAGANTFQQTRNAGSPPAPLASGANQLCLGGRIRFVGKSTPVGGSSSLAGTLNQITATIKYKLLPLR